jgi:DNA repair exonuclease SbcCD ATPase subunit
MSQEKEFQDYSTEQSSGAPRWIPAAIIVLAIVSIAALGFGFSASSNARQLDKERQALAAEVKSLNQSIEVLSQRLKQTEDVSTNVQGDMSVVTDKLKLTQGELVRARNQAKQIREDYTKQISAVETSVRGELATKANAEDLKNLSGDVTGVKSDLDATKQHLQMARGELGTLIARNHEEIEQLRRMGQRDYYEFKIASKGSREKLGAVMVELRGTNTKRNQYTVNLYVDDMKLEKKNRSVNEPIYFYAAGSRAPLELVVNKVGKNSMTGYLSIPKSVGSQGGGK